MKVDKGVCTTNDAYFAGTNVSSNNNNNTTTTATTNELNSIIKFETVFTTLVENKILAIKRECEQHESKKKSRTIKNILLRKSNLATSDNVTTIEREDETANRKKEGKNFLFKYRKKPTKDALDVEKGAPCSKDELVNVVVVPNEPQQADNDVANATLDSQSNELVIAAADDIDAQHLPNLPVSTNAKLLTDDNEQNNCDKLIIYSRTTEHAQVTQSTTNNNDRKQPDGEKQEEEAAVAITAAATINNENDESLATTIDISLQQSSVIVLTKDHAGELPINNNNNNCSSQINNNVNVNDKSDVAICDDGQSSQNTSDIEFSLVSENSISDLPEKLLRKKLPQATATVTNSDPISQKKSVNVVSPPSTRKPCERKAKSCQSTPIFGRHTSKHVRSESEGKKILTFQKELPKKYETSATAVKSQTIVHAPTKTTSATVATITTTTLAPGPQLESVHGNKKLQKHASKHRDVSIEYEITYDDDANQSPHGFISSFNQLTSQKQPAAIISANVKKTASSRGHGKDSGKGQQDVNDKTITGHDIELELDELNVDIVNKKKKRRSK